MFYRDKDRELSIKEIERYIEIHQQTVVPRLSKLERYYRGNNDITMRTFQDSSKPNNKIANPFGSYITDTMTGYFLGEEISYTATDNKLLEELTNIFTYTDEADVNAELAKNASIFGVAYELMYMDEDAAIRFVPLDVKGAIPIFADTVNEELLYVIRYYAIEDVISDKKTTKVEVYSKDDVAYYTSSDKSGFIPGGVLPHEFEQVPVNIYKNNEALEGDFEKVIPLIDAYDKMESDTANEFEYLNDCYLVLNNIHIDEEDLKSMKENRVICVEDGSAEWLVKNYNDAQIENFKTRMVDDIHKFAKCPNLADEAFGNNASGVSLKYKLMGLENVVSIKERKFKRALQRRLELICTILNKKLGAFDWRTIQIVFTRNIPQNVVEIADVVNKLRGLVSDETLISQLPFVEDVALEVERVQEGKEINASLFSFEQETEEEEEAVEDEQ